MRLLRIDAGGDVLGRSPRTARASEDGGSCRRRGAAPSRTTASSGGLRVPRRAEVAWELPEGPFTYWRAEVTALEVVRPG